MSEEGQQTEKPINTFREELEKQNAEQRVSEDELIRRDQQVMASELEFQQGITLSDKAHFDTAISAYRAHRQEIDALPMCEGKCVIIESIDKQIENLIKRHDASELSRVQILTLNALKAALSVPVICAEPIVVE